MKNPVKIKSAIGLILVCFCFMLVISVLSDLTNSFIPNSTQELIVLMGVSLGGILTVVYALSLHRFDGDFFAPLIGATVIVFVNYPVFLYLSSISRDHFYLLYISGISGSVFGIVLISVFYFFRFRNKDVKTLKGEKLKAWLIMSFAPLCLLTIRIGTFVEKRAILGLGAFVMLLLVPVIFVLNYRHLEARKYRYREQANLSLIDELGRTKENGDR